MLLEMQTPLNALSGVGPKRAAALADRGIATVGDLLFNLPRGIQGNGLVLAEGILPIAGLEVGSHPSAQRP